MTEHPLNTDAYKIVVRKYNYNFMRTFLQLSVCIVLTGVLSSCGNQNSENQKGAETISKTASSTLFKQLDASHTGVMFINQITENRHFNPIVYEYTYNGGGVAIGDVNNDGLLDIYVCMSGYKDPARRKNLLFINKGLDAGKKPVFEEEADVEEELREDLGQQDRGESVGRPGVVGADVA